MMLDYFKTNRSLQEQYTWEDIEQIKWLGDDKLDIFYNQWRLVINSVAVIVDQRTLIAAFLSRIRPAKKLAADVYEFDRYRDDDPQRMLKWLTESVERVIARERMLKAREEQKRLLAKPGAALNDAAPGEAKGKGKGKGTGKGKGGGKGKISRSPTRDRQEGDRSTGKGED